jgi:uncharacterized protein with PIN domain
LNYVIDSSVCVSIALAEPDRLSFLGALRIPQAYIAWPTLLEIWAVLAGKLGAEKADLHVADIKAYAIPVVFDAEHYAPS